MAIKCRIGESYEGWPPLCMCDNCSGVCETVLTDEEKEKIKFQEAHLCFMRDLMVQFKALIEDKPYGFFDGEEE